MIKNIILDLGGVIVDIDYQLTIEAFKKFGISNFEEVFSQFQQITLLDRFECGQISASTFRKELKKLLDIKHISDKTFDQAWNALLLDTSKQTLDFILELKQNYKIFLFSNTNEIHIKCFYEKYINYNINSRDFETHFDKVYYSFKFGYRKPHKESFEKISLENNLNPSETLFVDDSIQHIQGARLTGLHTMHITPNRTIFDIPNFIKNLQNPA